MPTTVVSTYTKETSSAQQRDFTWANYTEEPHASRRKAIIKAHPEVLKLCGPEPLTIPLVLAVVALQVGCAYALRNQDVLSLPYLVTAYVVGATANQNLFLAIHEISHNLAFRTPLYNRLFAIVANLPIGIPYATSFRPYHLTHHKSLGVDGVDVDLPTAYEAILLDSVAGKAFFATFQIFFYALRPMTQYQLPFSSLQAFNIAAQLVFDWIIVKTMGGYALGYLILSSFLAGSLHPTAGHFLSEHFHFGTGRYAGDGKVKGVSKRLGLEPKETYSYYGPLNWVTYNVGHHISHHDLPNIPWTRLPKLEAMAPEFYNDLPCHYSWSLAIWQFITDDRVSLWSRTKRREGGRKVGFGQVKH